MKQPSNWTDPDAYEIFMGRWSELLAKPGRYAGPDRPQAA
jgi:hypothetical protein